MKPICACGSESEWIDNGPRLQYHYCRSCKVEVVAESNEIYGLDAWLPDTHKLRVGFIAAVGAQTVPVVTSPPIPPPSPPAQAAAPAQHQMNPATGYCDACGMSMLAINTQLGLPGCSGATPTLSVGTQCPALALINGASCDFSRVNIAPGPQVIKSCRYCGRSKP